MARFDGWSKEDLVQNVMIWEEKSRGLKAK